MPRIDEVLRPCPPIQIAAGASVADALRLIDERGVSHLLVTDGEALVGVLCSCDLERSARSAQVAACMSAPVVVVDAAASAADAARLMLEHRVGCLPVMRGAALAGLVTAGDLRRAGLLAGAPERCAACGSEDHVRRAFDEQDVGFCIECTRRSEPPDSDEDTGVSG